MGQDTSFRERAATFEVKSPVFGPGQRIPKDYSMDGKNYSPELEWPRGPEGCVSFALICDDPDAQRKDAFVHWVILDLPADSTRLPGGIPKRIAKPRAMRGGAQGANDFGNLGYDGPSPPPGHGTHHYRFKVYALDRLLDLQAGATKADVLRAMSDHVLSSGELIGTYSR